MSIQIMRLEERIVLDGAAGATASDVVDGENICSTQIMPADWQPGQDESGAGGSDSQGAPVIDPNELSGLYGANENESQGVRVLILPEQLEDGADLSAAALENVVTVEYDALTDSAEDLLKLVAEALDGAKADSIAFAVHGGEHGVSLFAGDSMTAASLASDASMQNFWQGLGDLMNQDGRVDIMACDLAGSENGQQLVAMIEDLTGMNVAASTDDTGNDAYGGDWLLESGNIDLIPLYFNEESLLEFDGVLPHANPTSADTTLNLTEDTTYTFDDADFPFSDPDTAAYGDYLRYVHIESLPTGVTGKLYFNGSEVSAGQKFCNIDISNGKLEYRPGTNENGDVTFKFRVEDNNGYESVAEYTMTLDVAAVNDPPVTNVPGAQTLTEDGAFTFDSSNKVWVQDWDGDNLTVTLTVDEGSLEIQGSTTTITGNGTGTVTLTGSSSNINSDLLNMVYTPTADYNGSDTLTVSTTDGSLTDTETVALTISPVNDAPSISTPSSTVNVAEDGSITNSTSTDISISDDASGGDIQVQLSVANGELTMSTGSGASISGDGSDTVTLVGSVAEINAALNGMTYEPNAEYSGSDTINISVNDGGNTGTGGALTATDTVDINVVAVNDAPTLSGPSDTVSVTEDTTIRNTGDNAIQVSDIDAGNSDIVVQVTVQNGTLTYSGDGGAEYTGSNSDTLTLRGTVSEVNAALLAMQYTPDADYTGADTLTVQVSDQGNTGAGGAKTATGTVNITVTAVNDAPVLFANSEMAKISNDVSDPVGSTISDIFAGKCSDVDTGDTFAGIAVVGNPADPVSEGVWEFSTDGGDTWVTLGKASDSQAIALSAATQLRFVPADGFTGTVPLGVRGIDSTYSHGWSNSANNTVFSGAIPGVGGDTAFSSSVRYVTIEVEAGQSNDGDDGGNDGDDGGVTDNEKPVETQPNPDGSGDNTGPGEDGGRDSDSNWKDTREGIRTGPGGDTGPGGGDSGADGDTGPGGGETGNELIGSDDGGNLPGEGGDDGGQQNADSGNEQGGENSLDDLTGPDPDESGEGEGGEQQAEGEGGEQGQGDSNGEGQQAQGGQDGQGQGEGQQAAEGGEQGQDGQPNAAPGAHVAAAAQPNQNNNARNNLLSDLIRIQKDR